jgi:uncharacterized membrane protein
MNSVQLHLALTHVPVILSFVGLIMLVMAFIIKNSILTKTSYILLAIAGIAVLPVYFTGEGAEETIENLPGVSEAIIERHEELAKQGLIFILAAGLAALAAMFLSRWKVVARVSKIAILLLAVTSAVFMAQTAHLGGQIRHTEIRNSFAQQNSNENANHNEVNPSERNEKDDD